jgi:hypothetical protein
MAKSKICIHCGRDFILNPFNKHRQKYCSDMECQRARKRENMRQSRARKFSSMTESERTAFRRDERLRINRIRQNQGASKKVSANLPPSSRPPPISLTELMKEVKFLHQAFFGITAQLSGLDDITDVSAQVTKYAKKGNLVQTSSG